MDKQKLQIAKYLYIVAPVCAVVLYLLFWIFGSITSADSGMLVNSFSIVLNCALLSLLYIFVWIAAAFFHKKSEKDAALKVNLSKSVVTALVLFLCCAFLRFFNINFFNMNIDLIFLTLIAALSELVSIVYFTYKIVV